MRERRLWPAAALLVLLVAGIYGQTLGHGFLNYDDDTYIFANPLVKGGFTRESVVGALGFAAGNWHPLTWFSHMLDVEFFGLRAGGHHAVSAALHAANAVLVLLVLHALTGAFWRSALVAAVFAVHPLRAESVAWASERKDVLSAFFWLLTTGAWLRFVRRPGAGRYLAVLGLFVLGLASKPMLVTLPFALLLLDAWPLGRLPLGMPGPPRPIPWRPVLLEKAPLLLLSALASLVTLRAQTRGVLPYVEPGLPDRIANAAVSTVAYLGDFFWPRGLALLYPFPPEGIAATPAIAAGALLAALTAGAAILRRRFPFFAAGWLWYLGTLVPVVGLVQVGAQSRADRYTYLPLLGVTIAVVWLLAAIWPRGSAARRCGAALGCCAVLALTAAGFAQAALWRDGLTLLGHTVRVTRDNYIIMNNLGEAQASAGLVHQAIATFRETARLKPDHCNASYNLGYNLLKLRKPAEALAPLEFSLTCYVEQDKRLDWVTDTLVNLAVANLQLGRAAVAEGYVRELLRLDPKHAWARVNLPLIRAKRGAR